MTKDNWLTATRTDLFSHHTMKHESFVVDAFREGAGPGVLGRMLDLMERHGNSVGATAIDARAAILDGSPATGRLADTMSIHGLPRMFDKNFLRGQDNQQMREFLEEIHADTSELSGVFGDAYSQTFVDIWNSKTCSFLSGFSLNRTYLTLSTMCRNGLFGVHSTADTAEHNYSGGRSDQRWWHNIAVEVGSQANKDKGGTRRRGEPRRLLL